MKAKYIFFLVLTIVFIFIGIYIRKDNADRAMKASLIYAAFQVDSIITTKEFARGIQACIEAKNTQPPLSPMRDYYQSLADKKKAECEIQIEKLMKKLKNELESNKR